LLEPEYLEHALDSFGHTRYVERLSVAEHLPLQHKKQADTGARHMDQPTTIQYHALGGASYLSQQLGLRLWAVVRVELSLQHC
jgi:hypothetical protein